MANKAALRELQARLASRLQSTTSKSGALVSWLAVRTGGSNYLFPLTQSGEIFPLGSLQKVPYCQAWFRGVQNLRGGLFGIVDFAAFVAGGLLPIRSEFALSEASVVTLHPALEINCALMVDSLAGLRNADAFPQSRRPDAGAPEFFGNLYTDSQGAQWQEINLQSLSQSGSFLTISA
jgi:twitching motility protein PilI